MLITIPPENYQETVVFKKLLARSSPNDGLAEKTTAFIETAKPLQELIIAGPFRDYTLHNPNHSKKLIHLAGFIIPIETLDALSALELSTLISSFYLHDLGMVLTQTERHRIIKSKEFIEFIQVQAQYSERLDSLRKKLQSSNEENKFELETSIFQITEAALAEFLRPIHATKARYQQLIDLIKNSSGRNDLFEISGVSFENELIQICISHSLNSSSLLESNGIHQEKYPRDLIVNGHLLNMQYCSAILRLVDILDFDRERTPYSLFNALGIDSKRLPGFQISLKEWNKHLSVHSISINQDEIVISGDSKHPNIEHSVREFCKMIEEEIRDTQTVVRQNNPEILGKYKLNLPLLVRANIRSLGYTYKDYSIKLNETAIVNLLMGENLYIDSQAALRELIQNSIDACNVRKRIETLSYVPEITVETYLDSDLRRWIRITDNGIGMDEYVLSNYFFKIGNSYYSSRDFRKFVVSNQIQNFTPISRFGIGLLSVFMIGEAIKVITKNSASPRSDRKERTLYIDGVSSLAVVTENDGGVHGTCIHVLLRKENDDEGYLKRIYGFVKDNVIRPDIPVILVDANGQKTTIVRNNFIRLNSKIKPQLDNSDILPVQIDLERFSNILHGKAIFFFFKEKDGTLCYYDKNNKRVWGIYPLKESALFEKYLGGSRITVNGISMKFKKIGSLYNVGKKYTCVVLDVEVEGIGGIEYDVSRDRIFGKGLSIIRTEIFKSINKGLKELGFYDLLNDETKEMMELVKVRKTPSEPLDEELIQKIKELLPENKEWSAGIHKEIAEKLDISNVKVSKYITAMIKLGKIQKP